MRVLPEVARRNASLALAVALLFCGGFLLAVMSAGGEPEPSPVLVVSAPASRPTPVPVAELIVASEHARAGPELREAACLAAVPSAMVLVHGSLLDASRLPIRGAAAASVRLVDRSGRRRIAKVDPDGSYLVHGLAVGEWWMTASAEGYRNVEQTIDLRADRPRVHQDFTLPPSVALEVEVVTPAGRSLTLALQEMGAPMGACALVPVATVEPPAQHIAPAPDAMADARGVSYGVGRLKHRGPRASGPTAACIGVLLLDCDLPVSVSLVHHDVVLRTQRVESGEHRVRFVLTPEELLGNLATIRVPVVDAATRVPIDGARALLRGGTWSHPGFVTDRWGIAVIEAREPGCYDLVVSARGYETARRRIDPLPGTVTVIATVALDKEISIAGRVVDLEDRPRAASFTLGAVDPVDRSIQWSTAAAFASNGNGAFVLGGLGRREYVIRTDNQGLERDGDWEGVPMMSGNLLVDARSGDVSELTIRLRPASRLVVSANGIGSEDLRFRVVDASGLLAGAGRLHGARPRAVELPAGEYRVDLVDGRDTLRAEHMVSLGSVTVDVVF